MVYGSSSAVGACYAGVLVSLSDEGKVAAVYVNFSWAKGNAELVFESGRCCAEAVSESAVVYDL